MIEVQALATLIKNAKSVGIKVDVYNEDGAMTVEFNDNQNLCFTGDTITTESEMTDYTFIEEQVKMIAEDNEKRKLKAAAKRTRRSAEDDELVALAAA